jgi:hypothetical protein
VRARLSGWPFGFLTAGQRLDSLPVAESSSL